MFDANQRLVVCNKLYREIFELPEALTQPGTPFADIIAYHVWKETGRDGKRERKNQSYWISNHVAALARGKLFSETKNLKNGRVVLVTNQPLATGGWVDLQEDITEKSEAESRIAWLARHDTLTELANRFHFREELQKSFATAQSFSLYWIDLDHFKIVNDTLGHPVGDALLKSVAKRLSSVIRKTDILARLGGDEFALVVHGPCDRQKIDHLSRRIVRALAPAHQIMGHKVNVSASIGVALAPDHGVDADQILKNADVALYSAKTSGRGCHAVFNPSETYELASVHRLEPDLKEALRKRQFELHYQPIVNLDNRSVASLEALLRWRHPERGLVSPADFIPLAESTGLIVDIGRWVIATACKDATSWPSDVKVTVNLSSVQFEKGDLYKSIVDALNASGLKPDRLELEITETVLLRDHPRTHDILHRLRKLGVKFALDDFGTAYGSLSYLRSFPFDKIKIDRSFVRDFHSSSRRDCVAIVSSVAGLAKQLKMTTVAEGVETIEQFNMAHRAGCEEVQGFFFSKPVPATSVRKTLIACQEQLDAAAPAQSTVVAMKSAR